MTGSLWTAVRPATGHRPTVGAMPELHVEPRVLADAGRTLTSQHSLLADVAAALGPSFARLSAALPESRTSGVAADTGAALAVAVRSAAAELAALATALTAAAREYGSVEQHAAAGLARPVWRPV